VTSKWEELSAAVGAWQDRQQSDSFVAGRFAAMIGNSFADYVEAPTKTHIKFFRYIPDEYNPERDKYEEVGNGFSAVSQSLDGRWQFALGIVLERVRTPRITEVLVSLAHAYYPRQPAQGRHCGGIEIRYTGRRR
jgi:hypothetical protein